MKVLVAALVVLVASPATASATTFAATAMSPRDPAIDASLDVKDGVR